MKVRIYAITAFAVGCLFDAPGHAQKAYIPNESAANSDVSDVSVIDTATNTVTATITGNYLIESYGVAASRDGTKVYITNEFSDSVSVIDTVTNMVIANINLGYQTFPQGVAVTPDGSKLYVAENATNLPLNQNSGVAVIDTATNTVIAGIQTGVRPVGVAVSPDGGKVYVTNQSSNSVSVIATATNSVTATITVDSGPAGVAVTPDGRKVYVANQTSSTVSVIDTATNTVTKTISNDNCGCSFNPTFNYPIGVAVAPDGKRVYVATGYAHDNPTLGYADYDAAVIDTATDTVSAQIYTSSSGIPLGMAVTPDGSKIYVANPGENPNGGPGNNVSVLDSATNTRTALIQTGLYPIAFGNFITPAPAYSGGQLVLPPKSWDFGAIKIGTSVTRQFNIANGSQTQALQVNVLPATPNPPYSLLSGGGMATIGPGQSEKVVVQFKPAVVTATSIAGSVPITSSDPNNPSASIPLSGRGK